MSEERVESEEERSRDGNVGSFFLKKKWKNIRVSLYME